MTIKPVEYEQSKHLIELLTIVALIAPFFFWVRISSFSDDYRFEIVGVLWSYVQWSDSGGAGSGFFIFETLYTAIAFFLSILRFVFVIAIRKHQKGLIRKRTVWVFAFLSQIPMSAFLFAPFFANAFGCPIPILLIIGLFIDRKIGIEPPTAPWKGGSPETKDGWLSV